MFVVKSTDLLSLLLDYNSIFFIFFNSSTNLSVRLMLVPLNFGNGLRSLGKSKHPYKHDDDDSINRKRFVNLYSYYQQISMRIVTFTTILCPLSKYIILLVQVVAFSVVHIIISIAFGYCSKHWQHFLWSLLPILLLLLSSSTFLLYNSVQIFKNVSEQKIRTKHFYMKWSWD